MIKLIDNGNGTNICLYQKADAPIPPTLDRLPSVLLGRDGAKFEDRGCALVNLYPGLYTVAELEELRQGIDEALQRLAARESL